MPRSRRIEYSWLTARPYSAGSIGCAHASTAARAASLTAPAATAGGCGGGSGGAPDPMGMRMSPDLRWASRLRFHDLQKFGFAKGNAAAVTGLDAQVAEQGGHVGPEVFVV